MPAGEVLGWLQQWHQHAAIVGDVLEPLSAGEADN